MNPTLRTPAGLWRIWFDYRATPQYYPLVHTSFWIEYHLWGLNPAGYHVVNVLLHALSVLLLWRILTRLGVPGAWWGAALFAVHPVGVESVAWVTEMKNVLCGVFYFASALVYLPFVIRGDEEGSRVKTGAARYLVSLGLFVLALLSKTVACSLPVAMLLLHWRENGRVTRKNFFRLIPFIVLGAAMGLLTAWLERHHVRATGDAFALDFGQRIIIAGRALWFYAYKLIWPAKLTFIYPRWEINAASLSQWLFPLAAAGVLSGLWLARKKIGRGPFTAAAFFVITLFPALGFFDVYPFRYSWVADHFQYIASSGLLAVAGIFLAKLPRVLAATIVLLLAVLTAKQAIIYRNLTTLWTDTARKNPSSWMVQDNLGMALSQSSGARDALPHLELAVRLAPENVETQTGLGEILLQLGKVDEALPHLQRGIEIGPDWAVTHFDLGRALLQKGRIAEAAEQLAEAVRLDVTYTPAYSLLGFSLLLEGKAEDSIEPLTKAIQMDPTFNGARFNLANSLLQLRRPKEALQQLEAALRNQPDDPEAAKNLAWLLATSPDDSIRDGARAVELAEKSNAQTKQANAAILTTLSAAYAERGNWLKAKETAQEALEIATASGEATLAQGIRAYISLYQTEHPVRDIR